MEFARRPGLTNSNSEAATYGFVNGITPENIVVNRDNYVVLAYEAGVESRLASIEADAARAGENEKELCVADAVEWQRDQLVKKNCSFITFYFYVILLEC
jgi:hypothetical protein